MFRIVDGLLLAAGEECVLDVVFMMRSFPANSPNISSGFITRVLLSA